MNLKFFSLSLLFWLALCLLVGLVVSTMLIGINKVIILWAAVDGLMFLAAIAGATISLAFDFYQSLLPR